MREYLGKLNERFSEYSLSALEDWWKEPVMYPLRATGEAIRDFGSAGLAIASGLAWSQAGSVYGDYQGEVMLFGPMATFFSSGCVSARESCATLNRNLYVGLTTLFLGDDLGIDQSFAGEVVQKGLESITITGSVLMEDGRKRLRELDDEDRKKACIIRESRKIGSEC